MGRRDRSRESRKSSGSQGAGSSAPTSSALAHGASTSISGSGFGTRNVIEEIIDRGTAANPNVLWDSGSGEQGQTAFSYSTGFHSVAMPHSNITKYAVAQITNAQIGNAWLGKLVDWGVGNKFFYFSAYRRMDPNWTFGTECDTGGEDDNNTKPLTVSAGGGQWETPNWYLGHGGEQKCALTNDIHLLYQTNGGAPTGLGDMGDVEYGSQHGGSGDQSKDMWYNWVKEEHIHYLHSSAGQAVMRLNNSTVASLTGLNSDNAAGGERYLSLGMYSRQRDGAGHYIYMADVVLLATTGSDVCKRVMLANNATFNSATITEYQQVVNWTDNTVDFIVNKGALSAGTVWAHVINGLTVLATQAITIA